MQVVVFDGLSWKRLGVCVISRTNGFINADQCLFWLDLPNSNLGMGPSGAQATGGAVVPKGANKRRAAWVFRSMLRFYLNVLFFCSVFMYTKCLCLKCMPLMRAFSPINIGQISTMKMMMMMKETSSSGRLHASLFLHATFFVVASFWWRWGDACQAYCCCISACNSS